MMLGKRKLTALRKWGNKYHVPHLVLAAAIALTFLACAGGRPARSDYPITPVPFTAVRVTDAFWAPRIETNRTVTIPAIFKKCEETGRIDNFAIAGGLMEGEYKGERYNDTDVYKTIEGASYSLMVHPDPELDRYLDGVIAKIAAAQEPDGYLYTPRTASPGKVQPGTGEEHLGRMMEEDELLDACLHRELNGREIVGVPPAPVL